MKVDMSKSFIASEVYADLAKPFRVSEVEWKPSRTGMYQEKIWCTVVPYITAEAIKRRYNKVLGIMNWKTEIQIIDGGAICRLYVRIEDEWVYHDGVGAEGHGFNEADNLKGAESDALKRAARYFGTGSYLVDVGEMYVETTTERGNLNYPNYGVYKGKDKSKTIFYYQSGTLPLRYRPAISENLQMKLRAMMNDKGVEFGDLKIRGVGKLESLPEDMFEMAVKTIEKLGSRRPGGR
jgi:hypothetical protein